MRSYKRKTKVIIALVLGIFSLTACGKEDKDDIASDIAGITVEHETDSRVEDGSIPDSLDYIVKGIYDDSVITVAAEVDSSNFASANVYDVTLKQVDSDFLKHLADGLFDGEYSYIKPYKHCSLEELELEKQAYDNIYNEAIGEDGNHYVSYIFYTYYGLLEEFINDYQGSGASLKDHNGLLYHEDAFDENSTFGGVGIYVSTPCEIAGADYSRIRGKIDNHTYEMYYEKYYLEYDTQSNDGMRQDRHDPQVLRILRMDTPYIVKEVADMDEIGTNKYDYDTALKQAQDIMEKMGFDGYRKVGEQQLYVAESAGAQTYSLNGYAIWFSNAPQSMEFFEYGDAHVIALGSDHDNEWVYSAGQPYVRITVTDAGIQDISIGDIYSEPVASNKEIKLLSFEKMDEKAKEQLEKFHYDFNIDRVTLGYEYISYDGINYSVIPVWAYYEAEEDYAVPVIYVNALDGQPIEYGEEKMIYGYHPVVWENFKLEK
ncbi:MAG: hypothetical protein K2G45_08875 [Lachnospiraceae bacterium]|nr:hypothetical protein [Lachnospiraceae bacterium]